METTKDIAVFGGTFDPPTLAHEAIIRHCLEDQRFDEVWLMPSGKRTDKPAMHSESLRLDLLQTVKQDVFEADPRLHISDFELKLPQPTETIHTYRELRRAYPDKRFWFVFGADSIATMHTWEQGDYLCRNLAMLAVPRVGYELPPESDRVRHIAPDTVYAADISSSEVRARIASHRTYRHMVSQAVAEQIRCGQLYV